MPELTEGRYAGEFVVSEGNGKISRETITVLSGETLEAGAVLGKVTASGKYKALDPAAVDGSEAAAGILYDALGIGRRGIDGVVKDAGRIDVRFADTTLIDLAAGGTPVDLEFAYILSAQAKLVLTAHEVYLPKPKLAVEGPGGVQASFDFRGAKNDAAGRMLTVTLTNDLDGTVYA
jgi:hypothetical protein